MRTNRIIFSPWPFVLLNDNGSGGAIGQVLSSGSFQNIETTNQLNRFVEKVSTSSLSAFFIFRDAHALRTRCIPQGSVSWHLNISPNSCFSFLFFSFSFSPSSLTPTLILTSPTRLRGEHFHRLATATLHSFCLLHLHLLPPLHCFGKAAPVAAFQLP